MQNYMPFKRVLSISLTLLLILSTPAWSKNKKGGINSGGADDLEKELSQNLIEIFDLVKNSNDIFEQEKNEILKLLKNISLYSKNELDLDCKSEGHQFYFNPEAFNTLKTFEKKQKLVNCLSRNTLFGEGFKITLDKLLKEQYPFFPLEKVNNLYFKEVKDSKRKGIRERIHLNIDIKTGKIILNTNSGEFESRKGIIGSAIIEYQCQIINGDDRQMFCDQVGLNTDLKLCTVNDEESQKIKSRTRFEISETFIQINYSWCTYEAGSFKIFFLEKKYEI